MDAPGSGKPFPDATHPSRLPARSPSFNGASSRCSTSPSNDARGQHGDDTGLLIDAVADAGKDRDTQRSPRGWVTRPVAGLSGRRARYAGRAPAGAGRVGVEADVEKRVQLLMADQATGVESPYLDAARLAPAADRSPPSVDDRVIGTRHELLADAHRPCPRDGEHDLARGSQLGAAMDEQRAVAVRAGFPPVSLGLDRGAVRGAGYRGSRRRY